MPLNIPELTVKLFKIRYVLENRINSLCVKQNVNYLSFTESLKQLNQLQVIDGNTSELCIQIYRITSRGIHGEIISDNYIEFVEKFYSIVIGELDKALQISQR